MESGNKIEKESAEHLRELMGSGLAADHGGFKLKVKLVQALIAADFNVVDFGAMLDDARMGMKHLSAWEKITLVSDHEMKNTFAKFFGYMLSCESRIFKNTEFNSPLKKA